MRNQTRLHLPQRDLLIHLSSERITCVHPMMAIADVDLPRRIAVLLCLAVSLTLLALLTPPHGFLFLYLTWRWDTWHNQAMPPSPPSIDHFRVVPTHRLIFCLIDKNANSAFADSLCSLAREGRPAWRRFIDTHWRTWADFELGCSWTSTSAAAQNVSAAALWRAFRHEVPGWVSAVFVRDPLERFLSAYLSKCTPGQDPDYEVCQNVFGHKYVSLAHAVTVIQARNGKDFSPGWAQGHFRHQRSFCNGTVGTPGAFDRTYVLDRGTSRRDMDDLLHRIGVNLSRVATVAPAVDYHFPSIVPWPPPVTSMAVGKEGSLLGTEAAIAMAEGGTTSAPADKGEPPHGLPHDGSFDHSTHAETRLKSYLSDPAMVRALLAHYAPDYKALPQLGGVPMWATELVGEEYVRQLGLAPRKWNRDDGSD